MAYYTKEQIMKARQMDLLTYLQYYEPSELVRLPGNQYCTRQHDSLKISNGKWYWWSRGLGGRSALDYLVRVKGIPFADAVSTLLGESKAGMPDFSSKTEDLSSRKILLPDENTDADIIVRYLTGRGIDREIIEACIRNRLLYESKHYHSCIFVGYDELGIARYACYRSTGKERITGEASGSDKRYSFRLDCPGSRLHVFEGAIDLLSYATILKTGTRDWFHEPMLSLGGVYASGRDPSHMKLPLALAHSLKTRSEIREVVLHLDNDRAGKLAAEGIKAQLKDSYTVRDEAPPEGKDYNEYLLSQMAIPR